MLPPSGDRVNPYLPGLTRQIAPPNVRLVGSLYAGLTQIGTCRTMSDAKRRALPRLVAAVVALVAIGLGGGCSSTVPTKASDETTRGAGRTLSAEDRAAIADTLAETAETFGVAEPPQVDLVRVVSAADWATTQVQCVREEGFPDATLTSDGEGIELALQGDQQDAYALAMYTCAAKYPRDPAQDESRMTRDQKLIVYEYLTSTLVDCLAEHGYRVGDVPTEETFLASWDTGPWHPYEVLVAADGPPTEEVSLACPANTPPELIWGE